MSINKISLPRSIRLKYSMFFIISCFALLVPFENSYAVKSTCDFQHKECFTEAGYPACYQKSIYRSTISLLMSRRLKWQNRSSTTKTNALN